VDMAFKKESSSGAYRALCNTLLEVFLRITAATAASKPQVAQIGTDHVDGALSDNGLRRSIQPSFWAECSTRNLTIYKKPIAFIT